MAATFIRPLAKMSSVLRSFISSLSFASIAASPRRESSPRPAITADLTGSTMDSVLVFRFRLFILAAAASNEPKSKACERVPARRTGQTLQSPASALELMFFQRSKQYVDGRPRRSDLVRRQIGALARGDHARAHPFAALRTRGIRGIARLQDRQRHRHLPPEGAYRTAVQFGAHLHDEDPLRQGNTDGGAKGSGARQQAGFLLRAADRLLRFGKDGRVPQGRESARRHSGLAVGRLPG